MARKIRQLGPFLGLMTSVDAHAIPEGYAQDLQNVRIEDGKLRVRYGYSVLNATGYTPVYGFDHVVGYSGTTEVEEIIGVATIGGSVRPVSINASTGAATEIKNGVSSVTLNASDWRAVAFEDKAYLINPNNSPAVYQHTIGSNTSMTSIVPPAKPTTAMTFRAKYSSTSYTSYDVVDFTGLTLTGSTDCYCTGMFDGDGSNQNTDATNGGTSFKLRVYLNGLVSRLEGTCTIDLDPSVKDWSYNDIFAFRVVAEGVKLDTSAFALSVINNDGSPVTIAGTSVQVVELPGDVNMTPYEVRVEFKNKTRADWDNIRKLKFTVKAAGLVGGYAYVTFGQFTVGCVDCSHYPESVKDNLEFAYSYRVNASGLESDRVGRYIGTTAYPVIVNNDILDGHSAGFQVEPLGAWIELTTAASSDGAVDEARIYVKEQDGWRLVVTQSDATTTYLYRQTIEEARTLATASGNQGAFTNVVGATPFKGWMVWLKATGSQNICHSRVGEPLRLASDVDPLDDDLRGATYSMADNFGDIPVCAFQAGDALIVLGQYGAYAQTGSAPSQMSPCRKIPGSFGVANQFAACRWRDEQGNPGVAFVSRNMEGAYFIQVDQSFDGDQGFRLVELSADIRPTLKAYFAQSTVRMIADDAQDALWIAAGDDALVLRRPSLVNGRRMWERYRYYETSISYLTSSTKRGKQFFDSDGDVVQLERDQTGTGYIRDGATPNRLPLSSYTDLTYASYWKGKDNAGPNRRVARSRIHPILTQNTNGVDLYISAEGLDRTSSVTYALYDSNTVTQVRHKRFGYKAQGWQFAYQVTFGAGTQGTPDLAYIERVELEELTLGNRGLS